MELCKDTKIVRNNSFFYSLDPCEIQETQYVTLSKQNVGLSENDKYISLLNYYIWNLVN